MSYKNQHRCVREYSYQSHCFHEGLICCYFLILQGGKGLHSTLNFHSKKFIGILNGIDTDAWNPATDTFLEVQYTANDLQGKAENKEAMRRHLGLSSADVRKPLVILVYQMVTSSYHIKFSYLLTF